MKWVHPDQFLDRLAEVLEEVPARLGETALYDQARQLLHAAEDATLRAAILDEADRTENEVIAPLFEFRNYGVQVAANWTTVDNNANFGSDYLTRTAIARSNIFTNALRETRYFYLDLDMAGERLDGTKDYSITFAPDAMPPALGFWSLTAYNDQHFFEPNPLDRYSIGTKTPDLRYAAHGSLTIDCTPRSDQQENWLPAPPGPFSLYLPPLLARHRRTRRHVVTTRGDSRLTSTGLPHPLIGCLFHCPRTGAWRGSVQAPGSVALISAAHAGRVALIWPAWPGRRQGRERLKRGLPSSKQRCPPGSTTTTDRASEEA